ncbi:MAG: hypothetical protein AVDCRST_MAG67-917 [uncultured Solirubrobacteraceae bacterium]|uniref:Uncharacterized protein n=1 Tax=uncultured Solirubrobacteraceae bacterium TaxID=1162706 RepID=A0A6J4RUG0_9ACTN|nr:MAG: hypothetical protein AVDCRST_MAG67-917 [uncultured Solirubrobacteraceae bacterium]
MHSLQLTFTLSPFYKIAVGRAPSGPDGWLAERPAVEYNARTIEAAAALAAVGFAPELERNRQIADRVLVLIDMRSAGASSQAREAAARRRPTLAAMPAPREPSSRAAARPWGERSKEIGHEVYGDDRDAFLRHPPIDRIYRNRQGTDDAVLLGLLDAWLEDLQRNYAELVDGMPPPWHEHGELDFEASAEDPHTDANAAHRDFCSPARMRVEQAHRGELREHEPVATHVLRVERGVSPQPDGIAIVAPGERWHIRGHRLTDGIIMPCTGTYRISSPHSHTRRQPRAGSASTPSVGGGASDRSHEARCRR